MGRLAPSRVPSSGSAPKIHARVVEAGGKDCGLAVTNPLPVAVTRRDDGVLIEWDSAGHRALYPARGLRIGCPCAECVEGMGGRGLLDPAPVAPALRPPGAPLAGEYWLRISVRDGHGTAIYTFERLRRECPCARCTGRGEG